MLVNSFNLSQSFNYTHYLFYKNGSKLKIGSNIFLQHLKRKKKFNFGKFVTTKKGMITNFFSSLSFIPVYGSAI